MLLDIGRGRNTTLFTVVCGGQDETTIELFLDNADKLGIDLNWRESNGMTPFMHLTSKKLIKLFLDDERIDVNAVCEMQFNALFHLYNRTMYVQNDKDKRILENIETLLASPRFNIGFVNTDGSLALHLACDTSCYNYDAPRVEAYLKVAVQRGIDINVRDHEGLTPIHFAFGYFSSYENGYR